jgi:hypothetical protein
MAAIFEQTKDMGVLFGKGGLYGNVSDLFSFHNYCLKRKDKGFNVADFLDKVKSQLFHYLYLLSLPL